MKARLVRVCCDFSLKCLKVITLRALNQKSSSQDSIFSSAWYCVSKNFFKHITKKKIAVRRPLMKMVFRFTWLTNCMWGLFFQSICKSGFRPLTSTDFVLLFKDTRKAFQSASKVTLVCWLVEFASLWLFLPFRQKLVYIINYDWRYFRTKIFVVCSILKSAKNNTKLHTLDIKTGTGVYSWIQSIVRWTPVFSRLIPIGCKAQSFSCSHSLPIFNPRYLWRRVAGGVAIECDSSTLKDGFIIWSWG